FADILQNASFPDSEVDLAKRNLGTSLQGREAEPRFQANRALARVLFGSGPYSVIAPTQESIPQMTAAELRAEFGKRFHPDQAVLVVVGDFESGKMAALIKEKFGTWKAPATAAATASFKPATSAPHRVYFVARPDSVQTTLVLASFGPLRSDA